MTFEIFKDSRKGRLNKISDVKGVRVGHSTIRDGKIKTGVTCICLLYTSPSPRDS